MEQTILLKGVALFATLTGIQQWLAQDVALFDIMFVGLIVAFLIALEMDYIKHKNRMKGDNPQPSAGPFLRQKISFG